MTEQHEAHARSSHIEITWIDFVALWGPHALAERTLCRAFSSGSGLPLLVDRQVQPSSHLG
jgi:hypothetical protein